ncbi:MAG: tetratricopeptide repeat protein [Acidobacteriota bacterium]|nr:tetratricopeptide repeat protein [Acidobacteriota bacterium]MDQ7086854.1 tetratricopeptide repeat protein [Acidobacteriota bacterium]
MVDRLTRKEIKHDEFVDGTVRALRVLEENPRPFLYGAAAILGLVVVVSGFWTFSRVQADKVADRLSRGEAALFATVADEGEARPGDPYQPSFESDEARLQAAVERLGEAASGMGAGSHVALYLQGKALLEAGRTDEAIAKLEAAVSALSGDPTLGPASRALLAAALERAGQYEKAIESWAELADEGSGYPRDLALFALGRCQSKAGQSDEARETLEEVGELYPESPVLERARQWLATL